MNYDPLVNHSLDPLIVMLLFGNKSQFLPSDSKLEFPPRGNTERFDSKDEMDLIETFAG